jgi:hypothetical protein
MSALPGTHPTTAAEDDDAALLAAAEATILEVSDESASDDDDAAANPVFDHIKALLAHVQGGRNALNALHSAVFGPRQQRGAVYVSSALFAHLIGRRDDRTGPALCSLSTTLLFGLPAEFERMVAAAFAALTGGCHDALVSRRARKAWFACGAHSLVVELLCPEPRHFEFFLAFQADD